VKKTSRQTLDNYPLLPKAYSPSSQVVEYQKKNKTNMAFVSLQLKFTIDNTFHEKLRSRDTKHVHYKTASANGVLKKSTYYNDLIDVGHKIRQKQDKRSKNTTHKNFSPINNNLPIRTNLDIMQNKKELQRQHKTMDNINFINGTTDMDFNHRKISNVNGLISIDENPVNNVSFRDEAMHHKHINENWKLNTKAVLKKNTMAIENVNHKDIKRYFDSYATDVQIFRENLAEDSYSNHKWNTQTEDLKEPEFINKDQFLLQKKDHHDQFVNNIIIQPKTSNFATIGDSTQKEAIDEFKFESSRNLKFFKGKNNGTRTVSPINLPVKNIITKKYNPIDKFLDGDRSVISRDIRNQTTLPANRTGMKQTQHRKNLSMTSNSTRNHYHHSTQGSKICRFYKYRTNN
jgi:hypothetical protein